MPHHLRSINLIILWATVLRAKAWTDMERRQTGCSLDFLLRSVHQLTLRSAQEGCFICLATSDNTGCSRVKSFSGGEDYRKQGVVTVIRIGSTLF